MSQAREAPSPEVVARAILRELNDVMKSPRGDYYQGDIADPHRTRHIIERHVEAYGKALTERIAEQVERTPGHWILSDIVAAIRSRLAPATDERTRPDGT